MALASGPGPRPASGGPAGAACVAPPRWPWRVPPSFRSLGVRSTGEKGLDGRGRGAGPGFGFLPLPHARATRRAPLSPPQPRQFTIARADLFLLAVWRPALPPVTRCPRPLPLDGLVSPWPLARGPPVTSCLGGFRGCRPGSRDLPP